MTEKEYAFSDLPGDRQKEILETLATVQQIADDEFLAETIRQMAKSYKEWLTNEHKHKDFTWSMLIFFEHIQFKWEEGR